MKVCVIIPAAGLGRRFANRDEGTAGEGDGSVNKLEQRLGDRPVFLRTLEAFTRRVDVNKVLLAVGPEVLDEFEFKWGDRLSLVNVEIVAGGKAERWETVAKALRQVPEQTTHIAVHDAARPLVSQMLIDHVFEAASRYPAVVPATAVANTLKRVKPQDVEAAAPHGPQPSDPADAILGPSTRAGSNSPMIRQVIETVPRADLVQVQTPQVFEAPLLHRAYERLVAGKVDPTTITDDAGVVEALGERVYVVEGQRTNLKITRRDDLDLAQALVSQWDAASAEEDAASRLFRDDDEDDDQ